MVKQRPVLIRGVVSDWPAVAIESRRWSDLRYLSEVAGFRTVPIEIGSKYTELQWSQALMTLDEFISCFITKEDEPATAAWRGQVGCVSRRLYILSSANPPSDTSRKPIYSIKSHS